MKLNRGKKDITRDRALVVSIKFLDPVVFNAGYTLYSLVSEPVNSLLYLS